MSYTLAAAASATGLRKTIILRAIKDGRISAAKDERGEWQIEPSELAVLVPSLAEHSAEADAARLAPGPDVEELGAQIDALLRQAGDRLRRQLDAVRRSHEAEGADAPELVLVDRH